MVAKADALTSGDRRKPMPWWIRKAHRWIGLAMAVQFLAWTLSGLYFALFPIEEIRGSHLVDSAEPMAMEQVVAAMSPRDALAGLEDRGEAVQSLALKVGLKGPFWEILHGHGAHRVDAVTGLELEDLTRQQARTLAESYVGEQPRRAEWVTTAERGGEYRGKPLPAWRLEFDEPEKLHLYLHAKTGEVTAIRTQRCRIFDFLWMLHILDFQDRTDFSTWLLKIMAALGVITVISGFLLWLVSTRRLSFVLGREK